MDRKNIQMIEYRRKINDNLFLSVIISFKRLSAGPIFRDASGENIKKMTCYLFVIFQKKI